MYNGPGKYLTQSNPYAQLLLRNARQANNGTNLGGIASVLSQGLGGYQLAQDQKKIEADKQAQIAAQKALAEGLRGSTQEGARPDGMADVQMPGSLSRAQQLLAGMGDNPYAAELSTSLAMQDLQARQAQEQQNSKLMQVYDPQAGGMVYQPRGQVQPGMMASAPPQAKQPNSVQEYEYAKNDGYTGTYEQWVASGGSSGGGEKMGMSPVWATDANGNPVLMQLSNQGGASQVQLPQGITPQRSAVQRVDLGDKIALIDAQGNFVGYIPKGVAPTQKIEDNRIITAPGVPSGAPQVGAPQPVTPGMVMSDSPEQGGIAGQMPPQMPGQGMPGQNMPIPGQPQVMELPPTRKEVQEAEAERSASESAATQAVEKSNIMLETTQNIRNLLKGASAPATGTFSTVPGMFSNTNAGKVRSEIKTLQSGVAVGTLLRLKQASSTGASGFGALNKAELDLLLNEIGSLDADNTDAEILLKTLDRIDARYQQVMDNVLRTVPPDRLQALGIEAGGQSQGQTSTGFTVRKVSN